MLYFCLSKDEYSNYDQQAVSRRNFLLGLENSQSFMEFQTQ